MSDPEHTKAYKPEQPADPDETVDDVGSQSEHPSEDTLLQLAVGRLGEPKAVTVRTHLTSCAECTNRINQLSGNIVSFVDALGSTVAPRNEPTAAASPPDCTTNQSIETAPAVDRASESTVNSFGDYELLTEIARGGMGIVYKARQKSLNRIVALKMIKSGEFANQEQIDRFYKEAEAAANLDHPGIVPVYEVGELDGLHYFTMGFVNGHSLSERLRDGPLEPKEAARNAIAISEAVSYAHSKNLIHRDLKPGNVLVAEDDTLKITDFGLAKQIEDESELTATGQVLGTPNYMPPEQAQGVVDEIGPVADIYAIGGTLYCMLTGRPPFQAANVVETLHQVLELEPVSLSTLNRSIPKDLETICLKCLEKKPAQRYQTATELIDELSRYVRGEPIQARPIGRISRALRWCKRKPAQAIAVAAVLVLAVGGPALSIQLLLANRRAAEAKAERLLDASAATIPLILEDLDYNTSTVRNRLHQLAAQPLGDSQQIRVRLGLLPIDPGQLDYLKMRLSDCTYDEFSVILERIKDRGDELTPELWSTFHDDRTDRIVRFRAGLALATLAPDSDEWRDEDTQFLVNQLLGANTLHQQAIRQSLMPVAAKLVPWLKHAFEDDQANDIARESAANAIVDFAGQDAALVTELSVAATPRQHSILFPRLVSLAESDPSIINTLIQNTQLQPGEKDKEAERVVLGKRRAGAAINLLRMEQLDPALEVLRVSDDPESLTQFIHGCKPRSVTLGQLLALLNQSQSNKEKYGILLSLGDYVPTSLSESSLSSLVDSIKRTYRENPSSAVHSASGWLLRRWGFSREAEEIDQQAVPYSPNREWFIVAFDTPSGSFYLTFVVFPPGQFTLGSPYGDAPTSSGEVLRQVRFTRPTAVTDREITWAQFAFHDGLDHFNDLKTTMFGDINLDCAASGLSWFTTVRYCRWLSEQSGMSEADQAYTKPAGTPEGALWNQIDWQLSISQPGFRLPTEAEWEYVCRAGTLSAFSFGNDAQMLQHYGWYEDTSQIHPQKVGLLRPNSRGLFDLHGNVAEWCHDRDDGVRPKGGIDPVGADSGPIRMFRGGCYGYRAEASRSGNRDGMEPSRRSGIMGFRVVQTLPPIHDTTRETQK